MSEKDVLNSGSFAELFERLNEEKSFSNVMKKGKIVAFDGAYVIVDVGSKSEGRVKKTDLALAGRNDLKIGDEIEIFIDQYEGKDGTIVLSHEKALRESSWEALEELQKSGAIIEGTILKQVKSGFIVDIGNATAFLPGSQVDLKPLSEDLVPAFIGTTHKFMILKMDRDRGNIVVSRRAILEASGAEERAKVLATIEEGQIIEGTVKTVTSYGAFIDIFGVDGLIHNADLSWGRGVHAQDVLQTGQQVKVKVLKFDKEKGKISLGIKQLEEDPWKNIEDEFKPGMEIRGVVSNVTNYGIFVEVKAGVEGLVYVSEISWKKTVSPQKAAAIGDVISAKILEINSSDRRMSLSIKQLQNNPFVNIAKDHPVGSTFVGTISKIADFGLFVTIAGDIDGLVHMNDLAWGGNLEAELAKYNKGDSIEVQVLDVDVEKERIALGVKQLVENPYKDAVVNVAKGTVVTCVIDEINQDGLVVSLPNGMLGSIKKSDLSKDRQDRNVDRFAKGEKIDAKIIAVENNGKKISLSIKAVEIDEEKQYLAEYGSSDSGASLGDILGTSIRINKKD